MKIKTIPLNETYTKMWNKTHTQIDFGISTLSLLTAHQTKMNEPISNFVFISFSKHGILHGSLVHIFPI